MMWLWLMIVALALAAIVLLMRGIWNAKRQRYRGEGE
jgi:hypothetical protein